MCSIQDRISVMGKPVYHEYEMFAGTLMIVSGWEYLSQKEIQFGFINEVDNVNWPP